MRSISNRDYVIKVVSGLFLEQGFANTSMDEVVKQSGVSKSNIYYHFKSKDELTLAVLESAISSLQILFQKHVLTATGTLLTRLGQYVEMLIQELVERGCTGGCPLISLMVEAGKTNEPIRLRLAQFFEQQGEMFTHLLTKGQQAGEIRTDLPASSLAALLTSWLEGSLMLTSIRKSVTTLRDERDSILYLLKATA